MTKIQIKKGIFYKIEIGDLEEGDWGQCVSSYGSECGSIGIRRGLSIQNTQKTLIHEIIHAIDFEHKIELTEGQVLLLEEGIFKLLKLNNVKKFIRVK